MAQSEKTENQSSKPHRKALFGTVVSDKMNKTAVVRVDRKIKHPLYKKYIVRSKKYLCHDPENKLKLGDQIWMVESRPLSTRKRWALQSVVREGSVVEQIQQTVEA